MNQLNLIKVFPKFKKKNFHINKINNLITIKYSFFKNIKKI